MRLGLPYRGSKNGIAEWIVGNLPEAEYFVDLFCGGCAVTHAALLSGKYKKFIINDINGKVPQFFIDSINGKYTLENHSEWVSREQFAKRKKEDIYIALIWSFSNNGKDYIYGKEIETYKHAYHIAVFENDLAPLKELGTHLKKSTKTDIYERYLDYQAQIKQLGKLYRQENTDRLVSAERLQSIESLQGLKILQSLQGLKSLQSDYQDVNIPEGAVIYCDPPYTGTQCGFYSGFDSFRFHEWAREQENIFISEYTMPDDFITICEIEKPILCDTDGAAKSVTEKLYTNRKTYEKLSDYRKAVIASDMAKQISITDWLGGLN